MNRIYRTIWNATLCAWVAAPETARTGGGCASAGAVVGGSAPASRLQLRWHSIAGAIAMAWGVLVATPAQAICSGSTTVNCTGLTVGLVNSANNLTVNVQSGTVIYPGVVDVVNAVSLTGTSTTLNNSGTIDPSLLPGLASLASGVNISNAAGSTVTVNNQATGQIMGTSGLLGVNLLGLGGIGLVVQNGAGGTTTLTNRGLISGTALQGAAVLPEDMAVIALRGGARNEIVNHGTITGRVAMQASAAGNVFTNNATGIVNGSINLGAGNAANTFNAVTGSAMGAGSGVGIDLGVLGGLGIAYVPAGIVNGGTVNNGNTLNLANAIGGGSGVTGSGTINGTNYVNFSNLNVQSGTWMLRNRLFPMVTTSAAVQLTGGLLNVDSSSLIGASVTANGGGLGSAANGTDVSNAITLGPNGLLVSNGINSLTLSGQLTGGGALTKIGAGTLTLSNANNNYTGGTSLSAGTLALTSATALGTEGLTVTGAGNLTTSGFSSLGVGISLSSANLVVTNTGGLNLTGVISGSGSLTKGATGGDLTLSGANNFSGGLTINGGKVILANTGVAGTGTLTAAAGGTAALDNSTVQTLTNLVKLNGNLTLTGSNDLTLSGKISGTGGLIKSGTNTLILNGANDFTGNSTLGGGTLVLRNNTALGTGALSLGVNATLDAAGQSIGNAINLGSRTLTLANATATTLGGALSGTGSLIKSGAGDLTLSGASTYGGGTFLNAGTLRVGSSAALGTGALNAAAGTTLEASTATKVGNAVNLSGDLTIGGNANLGLSGVISGAGGLIKNGSADLHLNGSNTFTGNTALNAGRLMLGHAGALGQGRLTALAGSTLDASEALNVGNAITLNGAVNIGGAADLTLSGAVDGVGSLVKNGVANLTLAGNSAFTGGVALNAGTLTLSSANALQGGLTVGGAATLASTGPLTLGNGVALNSVLTVASAADMQLAGTISGNGSLRKAGTGTLTVSGNNTFSGGVAVAGGSLHAVGAGALGQSTAVDVARGANLTLDTSTTLASLTGAGTVDLATVGSTLTLDAGSTNSHFAGALRGQAGLEKVGGGTLLLSGDNLLTGNTEVRAGALNVSGSLASHTVNVHSGAQLAANGALAGDVNVYSGAQMRTAGTVTGAVHVASGGQLAVDNGHTATLGSLAMDSGSSLNVNLSAPRQDQKAMLAVNGDLTLNGTLNVSETAGFASGVYHVIDYAGTLSGNGLALGTVSGNLAASDVALQTAVASQVNLVVDSATVQFWDGGHTTADGAIQGGSGTWGAAGGSNWANYNGASNQGWNGGFAVFQGAAGTVTVDGTQATQGMQFLADGYRLSGTGGAALELVNGAGGQTVFRVGSGVTATLGVPLTGSGSLYKMEAGTLALEGANSYTGGTVLEGGTLSIDNSNALGSGALTASGSGTLRNTQAVILGNDMAVSGDLTLDTVANLETAGQLSGSGKLTKTGAGELALQGNSSFNGSWNITQGTVTAQSGAALGAPASVSLGAGTALSINGNTSLGGLTGSGTTNINGGSALSVGSSGADSVFAGAFTGSGGLNKIGSGVLELSGTTVSPIGNSQVSSGTLNVTGTFNSTGLTVNSGATLTGTGTVGGTTTIANGGHLAGTSGSTLNFDTLQLAPNANIDVALGSPVTGNQSLFSVAGTLTLDGTLNISDAGGFGNGLYRLFEYTSALVNNGLVIGNLPGAMTSLEAQLQITGGQVNLGVSSSGLLMQFWDGAGVVPDGIIQGGSGVWDASNTNWAAIDGAQNDDWQSQFAVFMGAAGVVTVDASGGMMTVDGMQFITDGYALQGDALNAVNRNGGNFAVRVDPSVTATLNLDVNGTGTLNKLDTGTLVLNGHNGYTGGTILSGGTLVVGNDSALGTGTLSTASGTTLDSNASVTLNNAIGLTGMLNIGGSNALSLNGAISGTGGLSKNGSATLTLGGSNSFAGPVELNAGTLVAGSSTALGSGALTTAAGTTLDSNTAVTLSNNIGLAGQLNIGGSNALTLNGTIYGSGGLTKNGAATLTLGGRNSFAGPVQLNAGTLVLASNTALGSGTLSTATGSMAQLDNSVAMALGNAVVLDGQLTWLGSQNLSLTGNITGNGSLLQQGTARLMLSGANTYSGGTTISGGRLVAANASALGTGNVTVGTGAALEVTSSTTLAVGGNLDFQSGSTYRVQADSAALTSSKINVDGTATLAGSVLHVGPQNNAASDFQVGQTYTILHASQINGTFSVATSNYAYLDAALGYLQTSGTTTDVTLKLQRKSSGNGNGQMALAELAETSNQASVANGIDSLPSSHPLFQYVQGLPKGTPAAVLASLAGDPHANVGGSLVGLGAYAPSVSLQHLRSNTTAGMRPGAPVAQSDGPLPASAWPSSKALPAWAEVVGHWQRYDGDGNAATLKQRTTGLFLGMDQEVGTSGWRVGGSLGYTNADGKVADRASESDVNSYSAAVYGGKSFGTGTGPRINVLGGLAYTWHDIATTRRIDSLGQTLKADYSAHTAQLFAEVGYAIGQYDKFGFEPFVGVSLGQQRTGSFQERGGFAALQGRSNTDDLASTTLGLRVHSDFQVAGKDARLRATVGWRHAFGDVTASKTMAFEGGQNFTVAGAPLARNTAVLGLEGEVALSRTAALVLGYRGELGSGQRDHAANVKLRWAF